MSKRSDKKDAGLIAVVASATLLPILVRRFKGAKASKDRLEMLDAALSAAAVATGAAKILRKRRAKKAVETNG